MSDSVITKMTMQEELNETPNIKCAEFALHGNKMQCAKKPEYKRVHSNGQTDYLCRTHYNMHYSHHKVSQ